MDVQLVDFTENNDINDASFSEEVEITVTNFTVNITSSILIPSTVIIDRTTSGTQYCVITVNMYSYVAM